MGYFSKNKTNEKTMKHVQALYLKRPLIEHLHFDHSPCNAHTWGALNCATLNIVQSW